MRDKRKQQKTYSTLIASILRGRERRDDRLAAQSIKEAVEAGFPVNYQPQGYCWALLHCAAAYNKPECCQVLIELGANANLPNMWGHTPFFEACFHNKINCAMLLIDAGARLDIPNNKGELPLDALEKNHGKAASTELKEYIARRISQLHTIPVQEEPAYSQEL